MAVLSQHRRADLSAVGHDVDSKKNKPMPTMMNVFVRWNEGKVGRDENLLERQMCFVKQL